MQEHLQKQKAAHQCSATRSAMSGRVYRCQSPDVRSILRQSRQSETNPAETVQFKRPDHVKVVRAADQATPSRNATAKRPLPDDVRARSEAVLGEDFSGVRVREDPAVTKLGALAMAQGDDLAFAPGIYRPGTATGRALIGHELAHVKQQRDGRVAPTAQRGGYSINDNKSLEREAEHAGIAVARGSVPSTADRTSHLAAPESRSGGDTAQLALPAVIASMGAAEWIAAGSLGYSVGRDALSLTDPDEDVHYQLDEMEGSLVPVADNDVNEYNQANRDRTVYEGTHYLAVWYGTSGTRKAGIKIAITFLYDGHALGSISMGIADVYDWVGWGGRFNLNITPRGLASRDLSSVRMTVNMHGDKTVWSYDGHKVFNLFGDGELKLSSRGGEPGYHAIG